MPIGGRLTAQEHAIRQGISYVVAADINSSEMVALVRAKAPTLVLSMHFDQILDRSFIFQVGAPILNIHPGRLPEHRGPCPSFWALHDRDRYAEVSLHRIEDETIDTGEVIARKRLPVAINTSVAKLDAMLFKLGVTLLLGGSGTALDVPPETAFAPRRSAYQGFPCQYAIGVAIGRGVHLLTLRDIVAFIWRSKAKEEGGC